MTDVLTFHNDNARTGQTLHEEVLTPANVDYNHFGKLWFLPTDGKVDAQPLYAAGIQVPGVGMRNVLYVVTEHDSVYAYDADRTNLLWRVSLLGTGETPSDDRGCSQVSPEIGITSTPVIDRQIGPNGTLFAVAMSKTSSGMYFQRLHAVDLATGAEQVSPVTITASYPGTGANSANGYVVFDPAQYKERAALLLLNGTIYTAWASHCDNSPYTGWIIGYDERTLAQTKVLNATPNGGGGAIWMSGGGLAADTNGNIYFLDGNGTFDSTLNTAGFPIQGDYGNAFIKVSTSANQLVVSDYFATYTNAAENLTDMDLGSGGAVMLPDMVDAVGSTRHLAVGAGKDRNIYLVDRDNMGKFNSAINNAVYQELSGVLVNQVFSTPAYFNHTLYYGGSYDYLKAFAFQNARLVSSPIQTPDSFTFPGPTPSISANGLSNAIVWAVQNLSSAVLYAYTATNVALKLYDSTQAGSRDTFGAGNKFITPTVASARVYVGTTTGVGVFGLLDQTTLTPLQAWRDNNFGNPSNVGAGANGASPAGDGVPNLVKYALGLDPFTPATADQLAKATLVQTNGQNYLAMTINRLAHPSDISIEVQVSSDLVTWSADPANTVILVDTETQLVVQDALPATGGRRFMRAIVVPQ